MRVTDLPKNIDSILSRKTSEVPMEELLQASEVIKVT